MIYKINYVSHKARDQSIYDSYIYFLCIYVDYTNTLGVFHLARILRKRLRPTTSIGMSCSRKEGAPSGHSPPFPLLFKLSDASSTDWPLGETLISPSTPRPRTMKLSQTLSARECDSVWANSLASILSFTKTPVSTSGHWRGDSTFLAAVFEDMPPDPSPNLGSLKPVVRAAIEVLVEELWWLVEE